MGSNWLLKTYGEVLEHKCAKKTHNFPQFKFYSEPTSGQTDGRLTLDFSGNCLSFLKVGQDWEESRTSCLNGLSLYVCTRTISKDHPDTGYNPAFQGLATFLPVCSRQDIRPFCSPPPLQRKPLLLPGLQRKPLLLHLLQSKNQSQQQALFAQRDKGQFSTKALTTDHRPDYFEERKKKNQHKDALVNHSKYYATTLLIQKHPAHTREDSTHATSTIHSLESTTSLSFRLSYKDCGCFVWVLS